MCCSCWRGSGLGLPRYRLRSRPGFPARPQQRWRRPPLPHTRAPPPRDAGRGVTGSFALLGAVGGAREQRAREPRAPRAQVGRGGARGGRGLLPPALRKGALRDRNRDRGQDRDQSRDIPTARSPGTGRSCTVRPGGAQPPGSLPLGSRLAQARVGRGLCPRSAASLAAGTIPEGLDTAPGQPGELRAPVPSAVRPLLSTPAAAVPGPGPAPLCAPAPPPLPRLRTSPACPAFEGRLCVPFLPAGAPQRVWLWENSGGNGPAPASGWVLVQSGFSSPS